VQKRLSTMQNQHASPLLLMENHWHCIEAAACDLSLWEGLARNAARLAQLGARSQNWAGEHSQWHRRVGNAAIFIQSER
jgi:hypothetical protein